MARMHAEAAHGLRDIKALPPQLRRRNRRVALALGALALVCALFAPYAVHRGWIYPQETTFAWPNWFSK